MFFNFWAFFLKIYNFEIVTFFSCIVPIQSTQFFIASTYKIPVFAKAFSFLATVLL